MAVIYFRMADFSTAFPCFLPRGILWIAPDWSLGDFLFITRWYRAWELTLEQWSYSSISDIPQKEVFKFTHAVQEKEKQLEEEGWRPEKLKNEELVKHAPNAMHNFRKTISLDQKTACIILGWPVYWNSTSNSPEK